LIFIFYVSDADRTGRTFPGDCRMSGSERGRRFRKSGGSCSAGSVDGSGRLMEEEVCAGDEVSELMMVCLPCSPPVGVVGRAVSCGVLCLFLFSPPALVASPVGLGGLIGGATLGWLLLGLVFAFGWWVVVVVGVGVFAFVLSCSPLSLLLCREVLLDFECLTLGQCWVSRRPARCEWMNLPTS
jgi:hypothetical protein